MAGFVEVMKQARRLCKRYDKIDAGMDCDSCPLDYKNNRIGKSLCIYLGNGGDEETFKEIEKIVTEWAAEHPEQVYPSWDEVWKNLFPGAKKAPCPRTFFGCECMVDIGCAKCGSRPIPAEIAEKLGIIAEKLGIRQKEG